MTHLAELKETLRKKGFRITKPRLAVIDVLRKAEKPLSPYDIQKRLNSDFKINTVTIYRILNLFGKIGLVHRTHTKEGYVCCDSNKPGCHFLAICKKCGRKKEFTIKECAILSLIPKDLPFKNIEHISEIAGICLSCSKSKNTYT
ncbi:hypothetical protein GF340_04245 [Candidatus Peregrinibacteria bacterium]|nr:hypothetical protein [Candidatus Peregrinibacteria bacterium]